MPRGHGGGRGGRGESNGTNGGGAVSTTTTSPAPRPRTCKFFRTEAGCSQGKGCKFSHAGASGPAGAAASSVKRHRPTSTHPTPQHKQHKQGQPRQQTTTVQHRLPQKHRPNPTPTNTDTQATGASAAAPPPPQQIPGFYFDPSKNKYFALAPGMKPPTFPSPMDSPAAGAPLLAPPSRDHPPCNTVMLQRQRQMRAIPHWWVKQPVIASFTEVYRWQRHAHRGTGACVCPHAVVCTAQGCHRLVCSLWMMD
jgi:hypothetical protein